MLARFDRLAAGSEGKDRDKDGCSAMPGTKVARIACNQGCQIDEVPLLQGAEDFSVMKDK